MAPFYEYMCTSLKIPIDQALLDKLKEQNAKRLDEINKQLEDAEKNLGIFFKFYLGVFGIEIVEVNMFYLLFF